jgi:excisionase family DNA binding protein
MVDTINGSIALTIPLAARALSCGETTVRNMVRDRRLEAVHVGSDMRITASSILAYLEQPKRLG